VNLEKQERSGGRGIQALPGRGKQRK